MLGREQSFDVKLTLHFQDMGGLVANETGTWRLFNTTLKGDWISFSLFSEADDRLIRQGYEGRVKSNVIEGTITLSAGAKETRLQWRATRIET